MGVVKKKDPAINVYIIKLYIVGLLRLSTKWMTWVQISTWNLWHPYTTVSITLLASPPKPLSWMATKTPYAKGNDLTPRYRIREVFYVPV